MLHEPAPAADARVASLRRRLVAMSSPDRPGGASADGRLRSRAHGSLPAPAGMESIFPRGVVDRGSVLSIAGAGSVLLGVLAAATAADAHVAIVGMPALSMLRLVELGGVVDRIAVIPDPGPDPVRIAAVLLDGIDVVVLHLGGMAVPPTRARAVTARVRAKDALLVVVDGSWPGTDLRLESRVVGYRGVASGHGRLRSIEIAVAVDDRSHRRTESRLSVESLAGEERWRDCSPGASGDGQSARALAEGVS
ncbi:hypothetical protein [Millisia brevis]|uniref:hypothetical protein n=1 Tax=Millisia brevis TaxID=264148 RepID=UPI0008353B8F|nr:hypothetical protein [Millisia brevis]